MYCIVSRGKKDRFLAKKPSDGIAVFQLDCIAEFQPHGIADLQSDGFAESQNPMTM